MNILDVGGQCKRCKKNAQHEFMECWLCNQKYHVVDCDDQDPMVQPSFLKSQWPTISRKWPCITFTCPNCREDAKTKEEHVMARRVRLLEENNLKTSKKLEEIAEMLGNRNTQGMSSDVKTFANAVANEGPSLIVIEKPDEEVSRDEKQETMNQLNKVARESKVAIKKTFTNKAGKTVVVCQNQKSKEAILPHVNRLFAERKISTPKPKLPTVSIPFIVGDYTKDDLVTALQNQNEGNGMLFNHDNAEVIFISPMKHQDSDESLYQAVIRVSEDLRQQIKANGDRVFIGSTSCPVYDRFYIKRCNRCQGFHHYQKECKRNEVCGKCSELHDTRKCNKGPENYKCINCSISGFEEVNHCSSSFDCPAYLAEQEKLKKSIHFYTKN